MATHGMVATAWLVSLGVLAAGAAAGKFWTDLSLPAVLRVTLPEVGDPARPRWS